MGKSWENHRKIQDFMGIDDIDVGRLEIVKLQPRRKFHLEGWLGVWDYLSVALTPD